jgi:hypothetical protein
MEVLPNWKEMFSQAMAEMKKLRLNEEKRSGKPR